MSEAANQAALIQGQTFVWHEIYSANSDAIIDFYTKALDFGTMEMPMGEMGTYKMLTRGGQPVCGVQGTEGTHMEMMPPHWSTYISVDDVDARLALCVDLGATIMVEPMDVPTVGRMALIKDPNGATVWLFKSAM